MAGRQIRLKRAELRLLRISELRRLMDALGISGEGHPVTNPGGEGGDGHGLFHGDSRKWGWIKTLVPLVNPKIAGKWMFIPLKMVLIGIDPYPNLRGLASNHGVDDIFFTS